jgi:hypothetical protein
MTDLPEGLLRYFEIREQHRADEIAAVLAGLTNRERALVLEAAVMGFVRGAMYGRSTAAEDFPRDSRILAEVVGACLTMPRSYPTLTNHQEGDDD